MKEEGKGGKPAEGVLWKFEGRLATHASSWERPHAVWTLSALLYL